MRLYERAVDVRGHLVKWVYCSRGEGRTPLETEAVVVVPFVSTAAGTRLLVTKEYRIPIGDYEYGFPSGLIDRGESAESACQRELEEETGYRVKRILKRSPGRLVSSAGLSDETFQYYLVEAQAGGPQRLEVAEQIETLLLSVSGLRELFGRDDVLLSGRLWPLGLGFLEAGSFDGILAGRGGEDE